MTAGFITLHRKIIDHPIWANSQVVHLFIHLLLMATYEEDKFLWNGKEQVLERGQLITGRFALAKATGIPPGSIHRYLKLLENIGILSIKPSNKFSLITILKYSDYQDRRTGVDRRTSNRRASGEHPVSTLNKGNKDNNITTLTNVSGEAPKDRRNPDVQILWEHGLQLGFPNTKQTINRFAISRLLKGKTVDQLKKAAEFSQEIRQEPYAPQVNNWMDLEEKYLKLRDFVQRANTKAKEAKGKSIRL